MKIIVAVDSFKGCLTSAQAGHAVEEALRRCCRDAEIITCVVSDGGDGMLEAFALAYGAELCEVAAHDPLMRPIVAHYGITSQGVAIIESAQACGLSLMSVEERAPLRATTYGVGEMVADAVRQGCRSFIVGLGGSGTSADGTQGHTLGLTDVVQQRDVCRAAVQTASALYAVLSRGLLEAFDISGLVEPVQKERFETHRTGIGTAAATYAGRRALTTGPGLGKVQQRRRSLDSACVEIADCTSHHRTAADNLGCILRHSTRNLGNVAQRHTYAEEIVVHLFNGQAVAGNSKGIGYQRLVLLNGLINCQ